MAKQSSDQNLFDLDLETQDIKLPGEDFTLKVPPKTQTKPGQGNPDVGPPSIRETMLGGGEMPPLIAVDIEEGDIPQTGVIPAQTTEDTTQQQTTETTTQTEETKTEITPPAAEETKTEETKPPATQGQQGESGKGAESEEKLSPTYLHAAALHEAGALPNLDLATLKELKPEEILNKINEHTLQQQDDQVEARVNEYKNQFNEDQKRIMDMFDGGVEFDDAANTVYNQLRYESIDEAQIKESPEIQEQLYREFLYAKGHNDQYINRALKQSKDLENLETDGITSHKELTQMAKEEEDAIKEQARVQKEARKQQRTESVAMIKTDVSGTKEIIKGIALTKTDQDKIIEYMTVPAAEIVHNGRKVAISKKDEIRRQNPLEFEKRLAYLIHLGFFGDNPKLDKVEKQGETNAINKLKDVLEGGDPPSGGKPNISKTDQQRAAGNETSPDIRMPRQINSVRHND